MPDKKRSARPRKRDFEEEGGSEGLPSLEFGGDIPLPKDLLEEAARRARAEEASVLSELTPAAPAPSAEPEPEPEAEPKPFLDFEAVPAEGKEQRAWYVVHCYSGYEYKVKHNLEQRIETMGMHDYVFQVVVPTIEEVEVREGKRRTIKRCLFPGYIMVEMILTDDSWYMVRNTPGVTGFVGMGNQPTPLRPEAVQSILRRMEAAAPQVRASFTIGQKVRIIEGPFADFIGTVDAIDEERTKVRVLVSFFNRETPIELDFLQVEKA